MIPLVIFVSLFFDFGFSLFHANVIVTKKCNSSFPTFPLDYDFNITLTPLESRSSCSSLNTEKIDMDGNKFIKDGTEPPIIQLWKEFQLYFLSNYSLLSLSCQKATNRFLKALHQNQYWAFKMLDSTAKLPSGILNGNVNQFGDYEGCLSVMEAQYCLAELNLESVWTEVYRPYKNLAHSYYPFKGNFDDPQHRIPDFSSIRWGMCIPTECSAMELEMSLKAQFGVKAKVRENMCRRANRSSQQLSFGDYFARFFFTALLLAVVISSLLVQSNAFLDNRESKFMRTLLSFALQSNWKRLKLIYNDDANNNLNGYKICNNNNCVKGPIKENGEIKALDGIRALCAIALLMCHKSVASMYNPYINRTATMEVFSQQWTVIARTAIVYTDCFLLISGLLTTNSLLKDLRIHGSLKFTEKLRNRIFRLLPNIVTLILFCTYILPAMNWGPLWPLVVEHHSELCKQHMWKNFFFIHNYFGFENMCLTHTHQVGIDMQLFILSYVLAMFWFNKKWGFFITGVIWILSTILRYTATIKYNLSHIVYFGIPMQQMFDTANLSYILPTHRATIYITGIFIAYIFKYKVNLNQMQVAFGWFVAVLCGALATMGPFQMIHKEYTYNSRDAAFFGAFSPIYCGVCLFWVIYSTNHGYGGWLGDLLCWKGFKIFTKISYSFYLVQFPVFFYNVGIQKTASQFTPLELVHVSETAMILFLSVVLTVCVEMPFQSVEKIIFQSRSNTKTKIIDKCR